MKAREMHRIAKQHKANNDDELMDGKGAEQISSLPLWMLNEQTIVKLIDA